MSDSPYLFAPAPPASLGIVGDTRRFVVGRVFCVGRNYAEHAREMGSDPVREPPFFFSKHASSVVPGGSLAYPPMTSDLHHEVELVVAIGPDGIAGHAVGIDFTRRDLQAVAKAAARPWDMAKGFDGAAPVGLLTLGATMPDAAISLSVDGVQRQSGKLSDMIWSVPEIIAELARYLVLRPGDLIFTGTPAGVGPVGVGAQLHAQIDGLSPLDLTIAPPA